MPINKNEVSFTYDVTEHLKGVPESDREDAANDAGEAALKKITEFVEKRRSPVKGNNKNFEKLSDSYGNFKRKKVGNSNPNLRLTGELIESLDVEADDSSFTIRVTGDDNNVAKAYNNNDGDTIPKRQFLPNDTKDEQFKGGVVQVIKEAIKKYKKKDTKDTEKIIAPADVAAKSFESALKSFKASKREKQIAQNIKSFKIEDIL